VAGDARELLRLLRLRLAPTAAADVVAGAFLLGAPAPGRIAAAALGSACLYAAGMAQNDLCDRDVDREAGRDRPLVRRPDLLPKARVLVLLLFAAGIAAAALAGAALPALGAAAAASAYNLLLKRFPVADALALGAARAANLGIGFALPGGFSLRYALGYGLYIAGVTLASRAEDLARPRALLATGAAVAAAGVLAAAPLPAALLPLLLLLSDAALALRRGDGRAAGAFVYAALLLIFVFHAAPLAAAGRPFAILPLLGLAALVLPLTFLR